MLKQAGKSVLPVAAFLLAVGLALAAARTSSASSSRAPRMTTGDDDICCDCIEKAGGDFCANAIEGADWYWTCWDEYTGGPIYLAKGEAAHGTTEFASGGMGGWSHTRSYVALPTFGREVNGTSPGWSINQWPELQNDTDLVARLFGSARTTRLFDKSGNSYTPKYFYKDSLVYDAGNLALVFTDTSGNKTIFHDFAVAGVGGKFKQYVDAAGNSTSVTRGSSGVSLNKVVEVLRSTTVGGNTTTESWLYDYVPSGANIGKLLQVTLRRKLNAGAYSTVRAVIYDYYPGAYDTRGQLGDLRLATIQDGAGQTLEKKYYRYYQFSSGWIGLKYVVEGRSYDRLKADPLVGSDAAVLTAADSVVANYADFYFEYDGSHKVTKEVVLGDGCNCGTNGSKGTFLYSYAPGFVSADFNVWEQKVTEEFRDLNNNLLYTNLYYTNMVGELILKSHQPAGSSQKWITHKTYDSSGRLTQQANPSAVLSFNDAFSNLSVSISATDGLVTTQDYYVSPDPAAGYQKTTAVKKGTGGTSDPQKLLAYTSHTDAGGTVIRPVLTKTAYRNAAGGGPIATDFAYTFTGTTNRIESITKSFPAVLGTQNGPGTRDTEVQYFDTYGRPTWSKDGDQFIHYREYDPGTAGNTKQIVDVDTTQTGDFTGKPASFTTVAGGGLHLKSLMVVDNLGRATTSTDPNGQITYTVYKDPVHEKRVYPGWNSGTSLPTGPTQLTREDWGLSYDETLTMSVAPHLTGGLPDGTEAISSLETLSRNYLDPGNRITNTDSYFSFSSMSYSPAANIGVLNSNYYRMIFGYDHLGLRDRTVDQMGTIRREVHDTLRRTVSRWIGTNDTPASGFWSPANNTPPSNMVKIQELRYDDPGNTGVGGVGDGQLTQSTQFGSDVTTYVTQMRYDHRSRLTDTRVADKVAQKNTLDNLGRTTQKQSYADADQDFSVDAAELRSMRDVLFDEKGEAYQTDYFEVSPTSGAATNKLVTNHWYNRRGMRIKTKNSISLFSKNTYDGAGRLKASFTCYHDGEANTSYDLAFTVVGDTVIEQVKNIFDKAGNLVTTTSFKRKDNGSGTGELVANNCFLNVRVNWFDLANRSIATADYGRDNGPTTFYVYNASGTLIDGDSNGIPDEAQNAPRAPNAAAPAGDEILVTKYEYDTSGFQHKTTDNLGRINQDLFDRESRILTHVENYVDGTAGATELDTDRTTIYVRGPGGRLDKIQAKNPKGGVTVETQETKYLYESPLSTGWVTSTIYPDSSDTTSAGTDQKKCTYDRLGRKLSCTDQRGVVHTFSYDTAGRFLSDGITTLPAGVDGAVQRIERSYDDWSRIQKITSYNAPSAGSVVNDVQWTYNQFFKVSQTEQSHSGAVVPGTTPKVQYTYGDGAASGLAKYIRPETTIYPASRTLTYTYLGNSTLSGHLVRLDSTKTGTTNHARYTYYGANDVLEVEHPDVTQGLNLDYGIGGTFSGLDRFGRITDQKWVNNAGTTFFDRQLHTYDRVSNRKSRDVVPTTLPPTPKDEYYVYDGLNRLTQFNRGSLTGSPPSIADGSANFNQQWTELESQGNWRRFKVAPTGAASYTFDQTRAHNSANEIDTDNNDGNAAGASITGSGGADWIDPIYDKAGNMKNGPKPGDEATGASRLHFTYDAWNRLVQVNNDNGSGIPGTVLYTSSYDGIHRRLTKAVNGGATFHYYYDEKWRVLEVRYNANTLPSEHYIWDERYIDALAARFRATTTPGTFNETHYYMQDANFNVTALINATHVMQERYTYDAYGNVSVFNATWSPISGTAFANEILLAGYRRDPESSVYLVRNRSYHTSLGRWQERDPLGYADTANLFEYVRSDPLDRTDPPGTGPCDKWQDCLKKCGEAAADDWRHAWGCLDGCNALLKDCQNNDKDRFEKIKKEIESKIVEKIQGILDAASESVGLKPERWEKEGEWWEQPCRAAKANWCQTRKQQCDLMCVGKYTVNGQTAKPKSLESCLQGCNVGLVTCVAGDGLKFKAYWFEFKE